MCGRGMGNCSEEEVDARCSATSRDGARIAEPQTPRMRENTYERAGSRHAANVAGASLLRRLASRSFHEHRAAQNDAVRGLGFANRNSECSAARTDARLAGIGARARSRRAPRFAPWPPPSVAEVVTRFLCLAR